MDQQIEQAKPAPSARHFRFSAELFDHVEHWAYVAVGVLLSVAALIALGAAGLTIWQGLEDWTGTKAVATIIERLLFVLMLAEILHTVRASMRSGGLSAEPFLVVGLIACIRRVLVSTLESTEATNNNPAATSAAFRDSMIELGVLSVLILVMVVSIYMLRRIRGTREDT